MGLGQLPLRYWFGESHGFLSTSNSNTDMGHYSVLVPVAVTAHAAAGLLMVLLSAPTEVGK